MKTTQILFAGFGGQGILFSGKFLAYKGLMEDLQVSWLPSYGPEMRGGTANCSVVVSDKPIAAPVVTAPDSVIAMNLPSLLKFEGSIKPGGTLIINSSLTDTKCSRDDLKVAYVPATEIAEQVGNPKGANVVILGAYLAMKPEIVAIDTVIEAMKEELGPKKMKFLDGNIKALYAGIEYVKTH